MLTQSETGPAFRALRERERAFIGRGDRSRVHRRWQESPHSLRRHRCRRNRGITTREYDEKSLPIMGPEALSFAEVTAKIGAAIGRQLTFQQISDEEAGQRYSTSGALSAETEAHVTLWQAIREGRLANITDDVERILGCKPIELDQCEIGNAAAFR